MRLEWLYILRPTKLHVFIIVLGCQMEACVVPIKRGAWEYLGPSLHLVGKVVPENNPK